MTSNPASPEEMNGRIWPDETESAELNLFRFVELSRHWWRQVAIVTLAMMLLAGFFTRFVAIRWYRAETVLRPVSQHESPGINQLVGGVGEIASMLGAAGDQTDMKAEEFISTVESYDFVVPLIAHNNLTDHLDATRSGVSRLLFPHPSTWSRYKLMLGRLDADYSARTGNLTLGYEDNDPQVAAKTLGLFLTALRDKVQRRELETAHAAAASLLEEADRSADALLRSQIYLMAADQIKQEKARPNQCGLRLLCYPVAGSSRPAVASQRRGRDLVDGHADPDRANRRDRTLRPVRTDATTESADGGRRADRRGHRSPASASLKQPGFHRPGLTMRRADDALGQGAGGPGAARRVDCVESRIILVDPSPHRRESLVVLKQCTFGRGVVRSNPMEEWKAAEQNYHDQLRGTHADDPHFTSNYRFYALAEKTSNPFAPALIAERCRGKRVLDYCCGDGAHTLEIAGLGAAEVVAIDISPVAVELTSERARERGLDNVRCEVMDAEALTFPSRSFDVVMINGVLHHLDLPRAYAELGRVLKREGIVVATEALKHNLLIHAYRKFTPQLRTEWEVDHILGRREIQLARKYFGDVQVRGFFHLCTLAAIPLVGTALFEPVRRGLYACDRLLLRVPGLRWQAWMAVFTLGAPLNEA